MPILLHGWLSGLLALATADKPASSQTEIMVLDGERSNASFSVKVLWVIDVDGQFGGVHGNVEIDHFRSQAVVDARIDANAVKMRRSGTENWVKSDEFFSVAQYPEIRFHSSPFPLSRLSSGGELPGTLSLRGIVGPITFKVLPSTCSRPALDCPVEAIGTIKRGTFGMRSRKGTLADKVELSLNIRVRESETYPASP
jgi:polyisoprenoid-binding protein YceI